MQIKMVKDLKGSDIILNLKEIDIVDLDSFGSSSCAGRVRFSIICETKNGYCEDPYFAGKIKILEVKKVRKGNNIYTLKVRFKKAKRCWGY